MYQYKYGEPLLPASNCNPLVSVGFRLSQNYILAHLGITGLSASMPMFFVYKFNKELILLTMQLPFNCNASSNIKIRSTLALKGGSQLKS